MNDAVHLVMCVPEKGRIAPAGMAASIESVKAPETPPKTSKKAAKENKAEAGNAGSKKRQSLIDELLHKTRRSAVAKTGKAASKKSGLSAGEHPL